MDRREQDILDWVRQETEEIDVPKKLEPENIRRMLEEKEVRERPGKKRRMYRFGFAAAACIAAAGLAVWQMPRAGYDETGSSPGGTAGAERGTEVEISGSKTIARADSYEQVYGYLEEYQKQLEEEEKRMMAEGGTASDLARGKEESVAIAEDSDMDTGMNGGASPYQKTETLAAGGAESASADYSETNVRQEGVDEGDIVKTDGRYLYVLEDNGREIAIVDTLDQGMKKAASVDAGSNNSIHEFYVVPGMKKLVVVGYQSGELLGKEMAGDSAYSNPHLSSTVAVTYDISDPLKPVEEGRVSQSGSYSSSRMVDGYLYMFSEFYVWNGNISPHEPRSYVPAVNGELIKESNIYLPPVSQANMYEIITAVDLKEPGKTKDSKAIFSKGGQVYVSGQNIYFYETEWQNSFFGSSTGCVTTIRKVSYKDGELEAKAQGKFDGYLNDSFSIDEYEGNLRVVTTDGDTNSVYVLDKELDIIGSIEDLAKDERVYSARFMGDVGYFVTFRETDPLFSVDLSDPKKPKIIGELKIPGFSEYLHFYGEDQLLGIGMNVDEETMITDGVKLTMFDISDKTDVKEADTYILENVYSTEVGYDYKAALVDPGRNIIGFAGYTEGGQNYYLFAYDKKDGFVCNMEEHINGNAMRSTRGVYIEDVIYVVQGNIIEAYSLEDYKKVDDLIL